MVGDLITHLIPCSSGYEYIRLGLEGDGGYVLPNDLSNITACFSPGVNNQIGFEKDLQQQFGISSHLCDRGIQDIVIDKDWKFEDFWLATSSSPGFSSLLDWVNMHSKLGTSDLILQMDIEGAEWAIIANTTERLLSRFRIIIIEVHNLGKILSWRRWFNEVVPFFFRLFENHYVAYLHANNCTPAVKIDQLIVPDVIEITFHRRDRFKTLLDSIYIPSQLDFECVPSKPAIDFFESWLSYLGKEHLVGLSR